MPLTIRRHLQLSAETRKSGFGGEGGTCRRSPGRWPGRRWSLGPYQWRFARDCTWILCIYHRFIPQAQVIGSTLRRCVIRVAAPKRIVCHMHTVSLSRGRGEAPRGSVGDLYVDQLPVSIPLPTTTITTPDELQSPDKSAKLPRIAQFHEGMLRYNLQNHTVALCGPARLPNSGALLLPSYLPGHALNDTINNSLPKVYIGCSTVLHPDSPTSYFVEARSGSFSQLEGRCLDPESLGTWARLLHLPPNLRMEVCTSYVVQGARLCTESC